MKMDFQSMMETFAEAWVAANVPTPLTEAAEQGLLLSQSLGLSGQSLDMPFDSSGSVRRLVRDSCQQSSSQSSQQTSNTDDESASPLNTCPSFGASDLKSGIPSNTLGRTSIPIHCIVERILSPGTTSSTSSGVGVGSGPVSGSSTQALNQTQPPIPSATASSSATTSSPALDPTASAVCSSAVVEQDSYAIISTTVLFPDLVRTALLKLGYSASETVGAKGVIQLKNWKPLTFDQISDSVDATVGDILGDIASVATLRIRLYSLPVAISEWTQNTVRDAVLELLREISQSKLSKLCQISQPLLSSIVNNKYEGKIGKRKCEEFGKWYYEYRKSNTICSSAGSTTTLQSDNNTESETSQTSKDLNVSQCAETRLTFHASSEVPQLRSWFRSNPKPLDRIFLKYAEILNQSPLRQERTQVTIKSLKNWWKNERQRERNLLKKKPKRIKGIEKELDERIVDNNQLLTCSSADIRLNESIQSSEDEPTLTMAFVDDNDDQIL